MDAYRIELSANAVEDAVKQSIPIEKFLLVYYMILVGTIVN